MCTHNTHENVQVRKSQQYFEATNHVSYTQHHEQQLTIIMNRH